MYVVRNWMTNEVFEYSETQEKEASDKYDDLVLNQSHNIEIDVQFYKVIKQFNNVDK